MVDGSETRSLTHSLPDTALNHPLADSSAPAAASLAAVPDPRADGAQRVRPVVPAADPRVTRPPPIADDDTAGADGQGLLRGGRR